MAIIRTCMHLLIISILYSKASFGKLSSPALDEECGIYNAIIHKDHDSSKDNGETLKLKGTKEHAKTDKLFSQRKWPWMAIIRNDSSTLCNGILVRKNFILTTASCLKNKLPSKLVVDLKGEIFKIKEFHIHKGYDPERPNKMAGDVGLIELAEDVPVEDEKSGLDSICLPRSKNQPEFAQECAVSYLWETNKERDRIEMDTAAKLEENKKCEGKYTNVDGSSKLLTCISTTERKKPVGNNHGQVVYFLTCKTSGYWSVFGLSKFHSLKKKNLEERNYTFYITLVRYLQWIKNIIYEQKPTILVS